MFVERKIRSLTNVCDKASRKDEEIVGSEVMDRQPLGAAPH